eukprot:71391-Pelagomonas_calceolata.AAC.1
MGQASNICFAMSWIQLYLPFIILPALRGSYGIVHHSLYSALTLLLRHLIYDGEVGMVTCKPSDLNKAPPHGVW